MQFLRADQNKHSKLAMVGLLSLSLVMTLTTPFLAYSSYADNSAKKPLLSDNSGLTAGTLSDKQTASPDNSPTNSASNEASANSSTSADKSANAPAPAPAPAPTAAPAPAPAPTKAEAAEKEHKEGSAFILNAESIKTAFYGEGCNLDLSFVERDPLTGLPASTATKKVQSVYLKHNNSENFPFVLTMQEYPANSVSGPHTRVSRFHNAGTAATWDVSFNRLLVRKDVKSQAYVITLIVNYTDDKEPGKLKSEEISAYVDMQGAPEQHDAQVLFKAVNKTVPKGAPGHWVPIKLNLANYGLDKVKILNVTLQMQGSPLVFQQVDQTAIVERSLYPMTGRYYSEPDFDRGTMIEVDYGTFAINKSAAGGIQAINFEVTYLDSKQVLKKETVSTYIEVLGGANGSKLTPRVLVEGYELAPKKIMGGEPFTLTLKLRNTSDVTAVSNMRLNISSQGSKESETAFLPQSGATAFFIKEIPAGKSVEYKLNLISAASLNQKAYPLNVGLEYQDESGTAYSTTEQVSLYVNQKVRVDFSKFELQPQDAQVGSELNAFCQLINKGRVSLYNAEVRAPKDAPYEMDPVYLGNVEAGATKSIDATLRANKPFNGKTKFVLHYEDENGNASTLEHEFTMNVNEMQSIPEGSLPEGAITPEGMGPNGMGMPGQEAKSMSKWLIALIVLIIIALAVVSFFLYRHFKNKKKTKRAKIVGEDY